MKIHPEIPLAGSGVASDLAIGPSFFRPRKFFLGFILASARDFLDCLKLYYGCCINDDQSPNFFDFGPLYKLSFLDAGGILVWLFSPRVDGHGAWALGFGHIRMLEGLSGCCASPLRALRVFIAAIVLLSQLG